MARKHITCVTVSSGGSSVEHITKVGGGDIWGPISRRQAHDDIKAGTHSYYTLNGRTEVEVLAYGDGYIRSKADATTKDNLLVIAEKKSC